MEEEQHDRHFLPLFDGSNYAAWKYRMTILLEERELLECILTNADTVEELIDQTGDSAEVLARKTSDREKRAKRDRKCKSLLVSRVQDSQLEYIHDQITPKDVWDALKRVFERRSIASRMHLKRQMLTLRFDGGALQQHFLKFDRLVREYRATGAALEELDVVCHLLLTLGSLYSTVVTALETMPEENLSIEFVKCRLLDEETKRKGAELCIPKSEAAFSGSKHFAKKKRFKCFGCKQDGHKLADCPLKKSDSEKKSNKNKPKAHVAEPSGVCFVSVNKDSPEDGVGKVHWYIDSGCSDHLVNDKSLFEDLRPLKNPVEIAVAKDDATILAEYAGTIKVISNVYGKQIECTVTNVLYVPNLRCNLFSVMRVDKAGMTVVYENGQVEIRRGSEVVACGSRVGKLYELDLCSQKSAVDSMMTSGRLSKSLELWHRRLGHLNARGIEHLI